jgi:type VI secretion system secreted protein VgrG
MNDPGSIDWHEQIDSNLAPVHFALQVTGVRAALGVRRVSLNEGVNRNYEGSIDALCAGDPPDPVSLLGRHFELTLQRGTATRTVKGIVRHAALDYPPEGPVLTLSVVPSMWRLTLGHDTRSYLDLSVPELVRMVVEERLGGAVKVDASRLTRSYERHELLLQYRESASNFIRRWMEREGIVFYDDASDRQETLILVDSMRSLSPVGRKGEVAYWAGDSAEPAEEYVVGLRADQVVGATNVAVSDYDWTHPDVSVRDTHSSGSPLDPAPEIYEHASAVTFHRYSGESYRHNTVKHALRVRAEAAALAHRQWTAHGTLVAAAPGHVIRVSGVQDSDLDGSYMIVGMGSLGVATEGQSGDWNSQYELVPVTMTYRPPCVTPRPVVLGPETARVVGPSGQEIETDEHGRVKVRFHWDRQRERTEEGGSPWIRVSQSWAGPGFGTFFLPRIGMEVVVSFLGGDPERPLITGCVYNGENRARVSLPADKTQSYVRTKSSLNSDGFNELRFEDAAGSELVYMHAQKDLTQEVLHDRSVDVGHDERVHVHHDRRAEVDGQEHVEVHGRRRKIQHADEHETFRRRLVTNHHGSRRTTHAKDTTYHEHVRGTHEVVYTGESGGVAHEVKYETGDGVVTELHDATNSLTKIEGTGAFQVRSADLSVLLTMLADEGKTGLKGSTMVGMKTTDGSSKVELTPGYVDVASDTCNVDGTAQINLTVGESGITISSAGISIRSGAAQIDITPSGVTIMGATTSVLGGAFSVLAGSVTRGGPPTWS